MERRNGQEGQDYATTHIRPKAPVSASARASYIVSHSDIASCSASDRNGFVAEKNQQRSQQLRGFKLPRITPNVWVFGCHASVGQTLSPRET